MAKRKMAKSALDETLAELAARAEKRTLAVWACDCAERALPRFENLRPDDRRPREALEAARQWIRDGVFRMHAVRTASLGAHAAAQDVEAYDAARSAARAAGQAMATAHVKEHAIAAAIYAATAERDASDDEDAESALANARDWQHRRLQELISSPADPPDPARTRTARSRPPRPGS